MVKRNPDIDRYLRLESDFADFLHFQGDPV